MKNSYSNHGLKGLSESTKKPELLDEYPEEEEEEEVGRERQSNSSSISSKTKSSNGSSTYLNAE